MTHHPEDIPDRCIDCDEELDADGDCPWCDNLPYNDEDEEEGSSGNWVRCPECIDGKHGLPDDGPCWLCLGDGYIEETREVQQHATG